MTSVAHETARPFARSPFPSWGVALTAAFLGWVIASFAVGALAAVAWQLGFVGRPSGDGLRDWPYPHAGWASLVANSVVWLWILAATALLVRGMLADRVDRPVSSVWVFLVLLATGFAPFLPHGLLELPWPVGLLLAAALLRLVVGARPAPLPKQTTAKLIVIGCALLVIPAVHAVMHPLWPGSSGFGQTPTTATFSLRNAGPAAVELDAVTLRTRVPVVEVLSVRVGDEGPFHGTLSRRLPFELERRSEAFVQLRLRPLGCGTGPALRGRAIVRYRVLGRSGVETLPVEIASRPC